MSVADVPLGPIAPRCATHPEEAASGTCARCGSFFCATCVRRVLGQDYCAACAARPDINYLERFRLKLWGRRDSGAWAVGAVSVGLAGLAGTALWRGQLPVGLVLGLCTGVGVAFFLGLGWARVALLATPLLLALGSLLRDEPVAALGLGLLFVSTLSLYANTRNQLFFRREVSTAQLQRLWHLRENNPLARGALSLGVAALVFPLLAPLAIVLGVLALRRVNPEAVPPIGRKGQALAAVGLGVGSVAMWTLLFWPRLQFLLEGLFER